MLSIFRKTKFVTIGDTTLDEQEEDKIIYSKEQGVGEHVGKTENEIIDEIHETFFTEVDRLLEFAKIVKSTATDKQYLIDKAARLERLGFVKSQDCIDAKQEIRRLEKVEIENKTNEKLVRAINYFSFKYPNYKFITKESVEKICEKYNLYFGTVDNFKGIVPEENLKHIEDFKIDLVDEVFTYQCKLSDEEVKLAIERRDYRFASVPEDFEWSSNSSIINSEHKMFCLTPEIKGAINHRYVGDGKHEEIVVERLTKCAKLPLEIAAPEKDFDINRRYGISSSKSRELGVIDIKDPVVLKPIYFEETKFYLVVTAWGKEASDELVVNQRMN